jgi:hypothetical protein
VLNKIEISIEKRVWESRIQIVLDTKSYFYANAMLIAKNVRFSLELTTGITKQPPNFQPLNFQLSNFKTFKL